jgi:hypothetical protein
MKELPATGLQSPREIAEQVIKQVQFVERTEPELLVAAVGDHLPETVRAANSRAIKDHLEGVIMSLNARLTAIEIRTDYSVPPFAQMSKKNEDAA